MSAEKQEYLESWQELHSGVNPTSNVWIRGYLTCIFFVSRLLNRLRLTPNSFTLLSGITFIVSSGYFLINKNLLALALVGFIGLLLDGVDGALAILQRRASKFGAVLDSVNDRIQESFLYIGISWVLYDEGYSLWITTALLLSLTATLLLEYARSRAIVKVKVTVWERPTRVLVITLFVVSAFLLPTVDSLLLYGMSAIVMILSATGLYQQFQDAKSQLL
ncbi:MAG: CDP-alcohol phosphatidyltransferase family protein [Candidatus Nanopelagicales bacterium]